MKSLFRIVALVSLLSACAFGTVAVSGTIKDPSGTVVPNSFVRFELTNTNNGQCSVSGASIGKRTADFTADNTTGAVSGTLYRNDTEVSCAGSFNTRYNMTLYRKGVPDGPGKCVLVTADFDISAPNYCVTPPSQPTALQYAVANASNSFTGSNLFSAVTAFNGTTLRGLTLHQFGDSITATCFDGCSNRWGDQVATAKGWTVDNQAVSGDSLFDQATHIYAMTVTSGMRSTLLIGQNDGGSAVGTQARKDFIEPALEAVYAYLTTPNKINATAATTSGVWTASTLYSAGLQTSAAGATITFTVDGSDVMVSLHKTTTSTSSWTANVDGVTYGPFDAVTQYTTAHSTTNSPHLFHVAGLARKAHTVIITNVSGGPLNVDWAASSAGQDAVLYTASPYNTTSNPETVWNDWESVVRDAAGNMSSAGLGVVVADVRGNCMDQTGAQLCTDHGDGIHPGLTGDGLIAGAFLNAMQLFRDPQKPTGDRFGAYQAGSFYGNGRYQASNFWSSRNLRDGAGMTLFGQYSIGGISNATGSNQGGGEINIGGSKYNAQTDIANICWIVNGLWNTTGNARLYQICGNGNIIASQLQLSATGNTLELRNGATSQVVQVDHTYTDASNFENFTIDWGGTSGAVRLFMNKAGTGVSRALQLGTSGGVQWEIATGGVGPLRPITDNSADLGGASNRPKKIWVAQTIASGTASNSDLDGTIAISASTTGTYTFAGTYTSAPICTLTPTSDPTATGVYWATATTTVLTANVKTSGTITFNYHCEGRN